MVKCNLCDGEFNKDEGVFILSYTGNKKTPEQYAKIACCFVKENGEMCLNPFCRDNGFPKTTDSKWDSTRGIDGPIFFF